MEQAIIQGNLKTIVKNAIDHHGASREALIPILSEINVAYGYIPGQALTEVKNQLHLSENQVYISESQLFSIATFYQMLSTKPLGRHVVRFCESAPCHVMGGRELIKVLKDTLKLQPGETSPDKKWSLIMTSCLGVCGVGPVLLIDDDIYGNLKPEQIADILAKYE